MLRASLITLSLLQTLNISAATTFDCDWQKSPSHTEGFYRPAKLVFEIGEEKAKLLKDTFLFRRYAPCWTGNFSSCAFGFDYDRTSDWTIIESTKNTLSMEAPGFYWSAELNLQTSVELKQIVAGDRFGLNLSGDDGDGVMFSNESFSCKAL